MGRDAFNTAVAHTVVAGLTQNYVSPTFTLTPTITLTPTLTPIPPTVTKTPVVTVTPTFPFTPTGTDTPIIPLPELSVTVNTNCRSGPGKAFDIQGSLLVGEFVDVYGIDPTGEYWYISNPDPGAEYCWLSGKFAEVGGAISLVPVITPPPPPTATATQKPIADFRMTYSSTDGCGNWWVEINLYNSGQAAFKSMSVTWKDNYSGSNPSAFSNGFTNNDGCDGKTVAESLDPGVSVIISAPPVNSNPAGRKVTLTATLCTETNSQGDCVTRTITFKP